MRSNRILSLLGAALVFFAGASLSTASAMDALPTDKECKNIETKSTELSGWCAAVDRFVGNCLACHKMVTPKWPEGFPEGGNAAPPLVSMKSRFPDKATLRAQIYDSRIANDKSLMPPFGAFHILSDAQIDSIVEFLYTL